MGDFNSHGGDSPNLGFPGNPHRMNSNGDLVNDFLNDQPMTVLNNRSWFNSSGAEVTAKGCFTFQRFRGDGVQKSLIDYAIVDKSILHEVLAFEVASDSYVDSDHNPIVLDLAYSGQQNLIAPEKTIQKTNWKVFTTTMDNFSKEMDDFEELSIESKNRLLQSHIKRAMAKASNSRLIKGTKARKLDPKLKCLIDKRRKLAKQLRQNDSHHSSSEEFIKLFKTYSSVRNAIAIRHSRIENERKLRKSLEAKGPGARSFWTFLKQEDRSLPMLPSVKMDDGSVSVNLQDRTNVLNDHLRSKFRTSNHSVDWNNTKQSAKMETEPKTLSTESSIQMVRPITKTEVESCLKSTKTNSAPGSDGITVKQLKSLPQSTLDHLVMMYNEILSDGVAPESWKGGKLVMIKKKDPANVIANYRPICLISVVSKLFTKILAKRIGDAMQDEEIIGSTQMGFRKGRNTLDNIFILQSILEISEHSNKQVYMMMIM